MTGLGSGGARPWRLGTRTRKGILVVHIVSAGVWIGIDVVMGVVIFTALLGDDATRALCYQALELFAGWPLVVTGLVCLASGVVLGLGTVYGLVRYWWVAIKLAITAVLTAVVFLVLELSLAAMATAESLTDAQRMRVVLASAGALALLVVNVVLGLSKPGWRTPVRTKSHAPVGTGARRG
jgi:hypothetical protein